MIRFFRSGIACRLGRTSKFVVRSLSDGMEDRLKLFQEIGLSEQKAKETVRNEKLASNLEVIVNLVGQSCISSFDLGLIVATFSLFLRPLYSKGYFSVE